MLLFEYLAPHTDTQNDAMKAMSIPMQKTEINCKRIFSPVCISIRFDDAIMGLCTLRHIFVFIELSCDSCSTQQHCQEMACIEKQQ